MLSLLASCAIAAGSYVVDGGAGTATVHDKGKDHSCHRLEPKAGFSVVGPAVVKLLFWVDLPDKPKKPRPVSASITLDGKERGETLRLRRGKGVAYTSVQATPSTKTKAVAIHVGAGKHELVVTLPASHSGCVALAGVTQEAETGSKAEHPEAPEEAVAAEQKPQPQQGDALALAAIPPPDADGGEVHEIDASGVGAPSPSAHASAAPVVQPAKAVDVLRLGAKAGGVLPRGKLQASFAVMAFAEVPASTFMGAWSRQLSFYLEGGYQPLRQQRDVLIAGRGQAQLIQNTNVWPLELGAHLRLDFDLGFVPYLGLGVAVDVTKSELSAFSLPPQTELSAAVGGAATLGGYLPLGSGGLVMELRYREVHSDLGAWQKVAEPSLSAAALFLGYAWTLSL